jgi:beta-ribofuranosylaminobenzene 5'-phosphate synthase
MGGANPDFRLTIFPRLHLTLLSMHANEYRANGGLGFSIGEPTCTLEVKSAPSIALQDIRQRPLYGPEQVRLKKLLEMEKNARAFTQGLNITVSGLMFAHSGFGSSTAIALGCLESLHRVNGSIPTQADLIASSHRGGTSGVGIHTYFSGGCVFDLGRAMSHGPFGPSHEIEHPRIPLLVDRLQMPDWEIGICIPLSIASKTPVQEAEFFRRICPIPSEASYEVTYHTLFGLYAAIREHDWGTFCSALQRTQACYWKRMERREYGASLASVEENLYSCGATAVGMSSLGPGLAFLAKSVNAVIERMRAMGADCNLFQTRTINHGRTLQDD